ncbi:MAG: class I SAM-dependent RNA methyltransferase [Tissierellia bacterium]|nr:class I SAM-dependent RNA methyltransferase [Tissierellia bacterium]
MEEKKYDLIATSVFGLEAVVKRECEKLGFEDISVSNGKVEFKGGQRDIARANLWLRSAERVLIKLGEFEAKTFEDLYQGAKAIKWQDFLSKKGSFIVKAKALKSKLMSRSDIQSIVKKSVVDSLTKAYDILWFDESAERYGIEVSILKDLVTITLDSSGQGLHKRGYRLEQNKAPMKETLAAALVQLSSWEPDRPLVDLFCGSGTILLEAGMIAKNIAPGIQRDFDFTEWAWYDRGIFQEEKSKAYSEIRDIKLDIMGFDIDPKAIKAARANAVNADLDMDIKFITKDMKEVGLLNNFGVIISNPPYGERIGDKKMLDEIYGHLRALNKKLSTWSMFFITSDKDFELKINRMSDRKRKLYNGRIEVDYYQFLGPNPNLLR